MVKFVPNLKERSGEVPLPSLGRFPCAYKRPAEESPELSNKWIRAGSPRRAGSNAASLSEGGEVTSSPSGGSGERVINDFGSEG